MISIPFNLYVRNNIGVNTKAIVIPINKSIVLRPLARPCSSFGKPRNRKFCYTANKSLRQSSSTLSYKQKYEIITWIYKNTLIIEKTAKSKTPIVAIVLKNLFIYEDTYWDRSHDKDKMPDKGQKRDVKSGYIKEFANL